MGLVVTISGLHGTGKSTYAKSIAREFGLRHVSAGELFREMAAEKGFSLEEFSRLAEGDLDIDRLIDERTKREAERDSVVLDGLLTAWMVGDLAEVKIFLTAPEGVRMERIAKREGVSCEDARRRTLLREEIERRRFRKLYNINTDDTSIYDLIINTSILPLESNIRIIKKFIHEYLLTKGGG